MRKRSGWTPSIVPGGKDHTFYLVLNDFGELGRSLLETDENEADLETIISGMLEGQYSKPVAIYASSTPPRVGRDVGRRRRRDPAAAATGRVSRSRRTLTRSWSATRTATGRGRASSEEGPAMDDNNEIVLLRHIL